MHLFRRNGLLRVVALASTLVFSVPQLVQADQDPLVAGWIPTPPLVVADEAGQPTGYFADLTRMILEEAGIEVEFQRYEDVSAFSADYLTGAATVYAGMPLALQDLLKLQVSEPVSPMRLALFAPNKTIKDIDVTFQTDQRVGHTASMGYWADSALPDNLAPTVFDGVNDAPIAALRGDIDMIFTSEQAFSQWSYAANLDHMFTRVPGTTVAFPRVVGVHPSRADLMPAINAAILRLDRRDAFLDLRRKHFMHLFDPAPEVLTVGVLNYPTIQEVQGRDRFTGFSIDVLRDLSKIVGLDVQFKEITLTEMAHWEGDAGIDVLPIMAVTDDRRRKMDFTLPIYDAPVMLYVRAENGSDISTLSDVGDLRLGVLDRELHEGRLGPEVGPEPMQYLTPMQLISALNLGEIDAVAVDSYLFDSTLASLGLDNEIVAQGTLYQATAAIGLRFGLASARTKLDGVIPQYLVSDQFQHRLLALRGLEPFWTPARLRALYIAGAALAVLALGFAALAVVSERGRRQARALADRNLALSSRFAAVLDAAQGGIVGFDRQGNIAIINAAARRFLGVGDYPAPFDWPKSVGFQSQDGGTNLAGDQSPPTQAFAGADLTGQVVRMSHPDSDDFRYVQLANATISEAASPVIGAVLLFDDVTEQEIARAQAERADKLSTIGQLAGGVAHDFNNLLAVVVGNLQLAQDTEDAEEVQSYMEAAIDATRSGVDLTRNMLSFARRTSVAPSVLDLNDVVRDGEAWVARTLPGSVQLTTDMQDRVWPIRVDRSSADSALLNLVVNARDAMEGQGKLEITTQNAEFDAPFVEGAFEPIAPGRYAVLSVRDTGSGIPPEKLDEIFEPFFSTKDVGKGTGLGLSMVMSFVRQSEGQVHVLSELGQGTTFKIYFPAVEGAGVSGPEDQPAEGQDTSQAVSPSVSQGVSPSVS